MVKKIPWPGILSILVVALMLIYSTYCQPGMTYDSRDYLQAAGDLASWQVPHNYNQSLYLERTPLYPAMLAVFGNYKVAAAFWLNLLSLCISLGIYFVLGHKFIRSRTTLIVFYLSATFATPLLLIGNFVWSEAVFLALLSLHYFFLYQFLHRHTWTHLMGMAFMAFLLCLQRNPGIFFVAGTCIVLLQKEDFFTGLKHAISYAGIALSGWLVWTLYCFQQAGTEYHPTLGVLFQDVLGNFLLHLEAMTNWYFPGFLSFTLKFLLFGGVGMVLWLLWQNFKGVYSSAQQRFIQGVFLITLLYVCFMSLLEQTVLTEVKRYEALNYLSVVFISMVALDSFLRKTSKNSMITYFFIIILAFWLVYPIGRSLKNIHFWHQQQCKTSALSSTSNSNHLILIV